MSEEEYLEKIRAAVPDGGEVPVSLLEFAEEATVAHPNSAELWLQRGHLIQIGEEDPRWELKDALRSYERAHVLAPRDPEVQEALGYWYDVIDEQFERAKAHLSCAVKNGGGVWSYLGLARVTAELGDREGALRLLEPSRCRFYNDPEVGELVEEIEGGAWSP